MEITALDFEEGSGKPKSLLQLADIRGTNLEIQLANGKVSEEAVLIAAGIEILEGEDGEEKATATAMSAIAKGEDEEEIVK